MSSLVGARATFEIGISSMCSVIDGILVFDGVFVVVAAVWFKIC